MDERQKQCYLASFNGKRGAERNPANYQRRDDGNHTYSDDEYYEWWYVDASFDNGYHLVASFQYRNIHFKPIIPTLQITIYQPDGTRIVQHTICKPEETYAGADWCDLRMKDSWLKDKGDGTYELYMMIKGIGARLTMKNLVPGWKLGTGCFYKDEEARKVAGWAVPVPYAEALGELYLKDNAISVKGVAYHDHNWGNYLLHKIFSGWYWGRIHSENYSIDYAWVFPREKDAPVFSPLLLARKGEVILSTDMMDAVFEEITKDGENGQEYAKIIKIKADVLGVKLDLSIDTIRPLETWKLPKITEWDQYYYRFIADYKMNLEIDGKRDQIEGEMLHEYMIL